DLDGYPVAFGHSPPLCRLPPDRLDDPDGLVPGHEGKPAGEPTGVLLMVGPTQSTGRDAHQRVVLANRRQRKLPDDQVASGLQDQRPRHRLSVQAGELILPILLDAGGSPDLPAGRDGNRTRRYHNEIRHTHAMRIRYRRGDFAFDGYELVRRNFSGVAILPEFDDGNQLFGLPVGNRNRRAAAARDLLDRGLYVVGRMVAPVDN